MYYDEASRVLFSGDLFGGLSSALELVAGDLGAVVRELAEWMGPHAESQGFRLRVEVEPDLPAVRFERDALHQVLFNLVDNSLKYSREAPLREIVLRRGGQAVVLSVVDQGPGIAPRQLQRLFEPFQRGEGALVRRSQGSGLGLALVKGLAQRMGAALSGRNLEPGGFEVRLRFGAA